MWALNKLLVLFSLLIITFSMVPITMAMNTEYKISSRTDGGYTLTISYSRRIWKPITPEGFFPKETGHYTLEIVGAGEDWSYKGRQGYYYSLDHIKCKTPHWEVGFVWVDHKREHLYLNLYWVSVPDKLVPMPINGKYIIKQ